MQQRKTGACSNDIVAAACPEGNSGAFCTFGYKWGAGNPFTDRGPDKPGPGLGRIEISYSFKDAGYRFDTHSQTSLTSTNWSDMPACSKDQIRAAFAEWASVAAISFVEKAGTEGTDIRIAVGPIDPGAVAFPNLKGTACEKLSGLIVFKPSPSFQCMGVYTMALHEIGHALGLGHVGTNNIMNPAGVVSTLQDGDKAGIISLYSRR